MKKITAIITLLATLTMIFASCGTTRNAEETTTEWAPDSLAEDYYLNTETQPNGDITTTRADVIDEKAEGLNFVTVTKTAKPGNTCGASVKGQPNSLFTIEIYSNALTLMELDGLVQKTSDENGMVNWTYTLPEDTEPGVKVIIVRQAGTNRYARTAFTVV